MVLEHIRQLLAEQLDYDIEQITADTSIIDDLGADSLDIVELMMDVEEQYGLNAEEEDLMGIKTVGDVVRFIEARI